MSKTISVQGAREHNLKNVNVKIPREKLTIITGLSGSGKSSLAFDTIYAEGQRRYVESLSAYARQFLQMMQKPNVDLIEGLSPAISIEQKTTSKNPRSTVGTVTEVYDYLRLLFARVGIPYSPATGLPIKSQTVTQIVDRIKEREIGSKFLILSPIIRGRKGEYKKELQELHKKGFQRVKIDGELYEFDSLPEIDKKKKHDIEVVVDRIVLNDEIGNRLADSVETALNLSDGLVIVENFEMKNGKVDNELFSSKFACPVSGFTIDEIEPRLFSFNNPYGACEECDGIGTDLSNKEKNILENILSINKLKVSDVMIPRASIVSISHNCKLEEIVSVIEKETHSRIPVYRKDLDDVLGMVHIKDVIKFYSNKNLEYKIKNILRDVLFVPPLMPVLNLLLKMQATKLHMALVIDEHGGTDGLVTIEDLVEEIVGEIQDEHDNDEIVEIKKIDDSKFLVNAKVSLEDFSKETNINLVKKDINTLGGFLFSLINRVPSNGEVIEYQNIKFQILDSDPRKIKKIQITKV